MKMCQLICNCERWYFYILRQTVKIGLLTCYTILQSRNVALFMCEPPITNDHLQKFVYLYSWITLSTNHVTIINIHVSQILFFSFSQSHTRFCSNRYFIVWMYITHFVFRLIQFISLFVASVLLKTLSVSLFEWLYVFANVDYLNQTMKWMYY